MVNLHRWVLHDFAIMSKTVTLHYVAARGAADALRLCLSLGVAGGLFDAKFDVSGKPPAGTLFAGTLPAVTVSDGGAAAKTVQHPCACLRLLGTLSGLYPGEPHAGAQVRATATPHAFSANLAGRGAHFEL